MRVSPSFCKYGNHESTPALMYSYSDEENGIPRDTQTCARCYCKHLLKFYPGERSQRMVSHTLNFHQIELENELHIL